MSARLVSSTMGDEAMPALVGNFQTSSPVSRFSAHMFVSYEPMKTMSFQLVGLVRISSSVLKIHFGCMPPV